VSSPFSYPLDGAANVFLEPRWLSVPVTVPDSIGNCYVIGTGIADFTADPPWHWQDGPDVPLLGVTFTLTFPAALAKDDVYIPGSGIASVGLALAERDTDSETTDWLLALDTITVSDVEPPSRDLVVELTGAYRGDCWMDKLAYHVGFLIHQAPRRPWRLVVKDSVSDVLRDPGP
jgi:hypothetical protein